MPRNGCGTLHTGLSKKVREHQSVWMGMSVHHYQLIYMRVVIVHAQGNQLLPKIISRTFGKYFFNAFFIMQRLGCKRIGYGQIRLILHLFFYFYSDSNTNTDRISYSATSNRIRMDVDIVSMRFEYLNMDMVSDVLNIQTLIRTDLNSSKWIWTRMLSENICTICTPTQRITL